MQLERVVFWSFGATAFPFLSTSTVLTILDAVTTSTLHMEVVVAAAVFEVIALGCLALVLVLRSADWSGYRPPSKMRILLVPSICATFATLAGALTLAELILREKENQAASRMNADIAICAVAIFTQAIFYATALIARPRLDNSLYTRSQDDIRATTPRQDPTPPMSLRILTPPKPLIRRDSNPSPTLTNNSSNSLPSLRTSVNQMVRPITSKTKLITSRVNTSHDTKLSQSLRSSIDSFGQLDAFDTWDTSDVDSQNRDAVLHTASRRTPALEPIPGSRPASRALESLEAALSDPSLPRTASTTPSPVEQMSSPVIDRPITAYSNYTSRSRHGGSMVSLTSRPTSPSVNEAHIHPLFRTDSPTPPPAATPGTVIHASPMGGQYIAPPNRPYSRMRAGSRETLRGRSPSLLRSTSVENVAPGIETPPKRELTPPIPDFILSGVS
ncbi:hypothetical protein NA57DRAFT_77297 [Rhizodiscina lignyota]|uniref:Uncharacterized protein n=1 Tax=Rhizodiscina lignyota TaxID=1504668 RepID=A0A9P4M8Q0_9PEZI|nr:hypothetical protein NA57DRAFT_77297 [Rhizodiscina lignyota]